MATRNFFAWKLYSVARAQDNTNKISKRRSKARASSDPLIELSDKEFRNKYRLSKKVFKHLCRELRRLTTLKASQRVRLETKVLTALLFYASGSHQDTVGVAKNLSQKMCSVYIEDVTKALTSKRMLEEYIKFPDTPEARQEISQRFYDKYGVIGCIDGRHFRILRPAVDEEHHYFSQNHYHSLNVQMVCDDEYRITSVNPKFGGANSESFVWENSDLNSYMQSLHKIGESTWLLGDSNYPQRPWLMTPILDATPNTPEWNYNEKHKKTSGVIARTFGRLKRRWRCLNNNKILHYKPLKCASIIQACCVLYNFEMSSNMDDDEDCVEEPDDQENCIVEHERTNEFIKGCAVRQEIVTSMCDE